MSDACYSQPSLPPVLCHPLACFDSTPISAPNWQSIAPPASPSHPLPCTLCCAVFLCLHPLHVSPLTPTTHPTPPLTPPLPISFLSSVFHYTMLPCAAGHAKQATTVSRAQREEVKKRQGHKSGRASGNQSGHNRSRGGSRREGVIQNGSDGWGRHVKHTEGAGTDVVAGVGAELDFRWNGWSGGNGQRLAMNGGRVARRACKKRGQVPACAALLTALRSIPLHEATAGFQRRRPKMFPGGLGAAPPVLAVAVAVAVVLVVLDPAAAAPAVGLTMLAAAGPSCGGAVCAAVELPPAPVPAVQPHTCRTWVGVTKALSPPAPALRAVGGGRGRGAGDYSDGRTAQRSAGVQHPRRSGAATRADRGLTTCTTAFPAIQTARAEPARHSRCLHRQGEARVGHVGGGACWRR